jgi:ABC-type uncharacterized transport system permease subunit
MSHARPEYAVTVAVIGVLLAIGIPCLKRGQIVTGVIFVAMALGVTVWAIVAIIRSRG